MKLLLEYFGLIIFAFVLLVGGLILLPRVTTMPSVSPSELVGFGLALVVIAGGFAWFYLASSHQGRPPATGP
jgi:hypothetical protein